MSGQSILIVKGGVTGVSAHAPRQRNSPYRQTVRRLIYNIRRPKHPHLPILQYKTFPQVTASWTHYKWLFGDISIWLFIGWIMFVWFYSCYLHVKVVDDFYVISCDFIKFCFNFCFKFWCFYFNISVNSIVGTDVLRDSILGCGKVRENSIWN